VVLRRTVIAIVTAVLAACSGCQTQAEHKKAARQRWEKATAGIKLTLAQQQYENGKYEQAEQTVLECIKAEPDNPQPRLLLGKLLLARGRSDEAVGQLSLAVQLDSGLHEGWYWLGVATQENRNYGQACKYYSKALSLRPGNVSYILAVADVQAAENNFSKALELLTEKMAALPRDVSLRVAAADLLHRLGENKRAIELYKQAILLTSDNEAIAEALGYCYLFSDKWEEAAEIFETLAEQCRDEQKRKLYLQVTALCSMNTAQYGKAIKSYSQLSVAERDNAEIWVKMGHAALGAGAVNRALKCGQKALALRFAYADAIALVGCAQYVSGDYVAAADSFRRITVDKKNGWFSWLMQARCYERLGETTRAKRAYEKALELNPDSELAVLLAKGENSKIDAYHGGIRPQMED